MQDRFKFRIFEYETKEMVELDAIGYSSFDPFAEGKSRLIMIPSGLGNTFHYDKQCLYDNDKFSEPMQCTGLKDKNGKLIYEGDILRYPPQNKDEEKNYVACEVFFHNNDCCDNHIGFQMNRYRFQGSLCGIANYGTKYKFIPKNTERMEVIGNIYTDAHLLEENKND